MVAVSFWFLKWVISGKKLLFLSFTNILSQQPVVKLEPHRPHTHFRWVALSSHPYIPAWARNRFFVYLWREWLCNFALARLGWPHARASWLWRVGERALTRMRATKNQQLISSKLHPPHTRNTPGKRIGSFISLSPPFSRGACLPNLIIVTPMTLHKLIVINRQTF